MIVRAVFLRALPGAMLQSRMQALVDERLLSERRRQIEDLATKVMTLEADRREAKSELRATEQKHQVEKHFWSFSLFWFVEDPI